MVGLPRLRSHELTRGVRAAAVVAALLAAALSCSTDDGLTADSTCEEYLAADSETRAAAVRTIGAEEGIAGAGNPLAVGNTDFNCGLNPSQSLLNAIRSD